MPTTWANLAAGLLVLASTIQWLIAVLFEDRFRRGTDRTDLRDSRDIAPGRTAVLLSVRGADPSLEHTIQSLLDQDHPDFEIHVVVDHCDDPAWERIATLQTGHRHGDRLHAQLMKDPPRRCSLKCHSLVQACEALDDSFVYVALIDADVVPHRQWLRSLTAPLASDPGIGGVTGAQWFEPPADAPWGSWIRSAWNGGAIVPTIHYANPWAGSFALRHADLRASGLLDHWRRSMVDDGPIRAAMNSIDKTIVFAPSLVMINRESCDWRFALRWMTRMLTWSRLHESTFWLTILHAAFSNFVFGINVLILVAAVLDLALPVTFWPHPEVVAGGATVALAVSGMLCLAAYQSARRCVWQSAHWRGDSLAPMTVRMRWRVYWSAAPAHAFFGIACLRSLFLRRIQWRGIDYRIDKADVVERLNYHPYTGGSAPPDHSL